MSRTVSTELLSEDGRSRFVVSVETGAPTCWCDSGQPCLAIHECVDDDEREPPTLVICRRCLDELFAKLLDD
jgi:hypothetical protein